MPVHFFRSRGFYYGWVIIGTMFITLCLVLGLRFSFGIFYVAILNDTGWSRDDTALIFSISMAVYAGTIILSGALFDRFGPRRVFPVAVVLLSIGIWLCSTIETIWNFYIYYGVLVGMAFSMLGFPTHMAVVPRWFIRRRGLAAAMALSGVGLGALTIPFFSEALIQVIGWRATYGYYSIGLLVILVPLTLFFHRDSPQAIGLFPDGASESPPEPRNSPVGGYTALGAMRTPVWWLLFIAVTMIGFVSMTMVVHQTRLSLDVGFSVAAATTFFALTGFSRAVGQLFWGWISDRLNRSFIFVGVTILGIIGVGFLFAAMETPNIFFLSQFTLLFGFGFMGLSPVYASTVADIFPGRNLGKILGMLDIGFGVGASVGPWLAGWLFERHGHYRFTLYLLIAAMLITGITMILVQKLKK